MYPFLLDPFRLHLSQTFVWIGLDTGVTEISLGHFVGADCNIAYYDLDADFSHPTVDMDTTGFRMLVATFMQYAGDLG